MVLTEISVTTMPQRDDWPSPPDPTVIDDFFAELPFDRRTRSRVWLGQLGHATGSGAQLLGSQARWQVVQAAVGLREIGGDLGTMARAAVPGRRARRIMALVLIVGLLLSVAGAGFSGFNEYTALKHLSSDAISALSRVPRDLGVSGSHLPHQPVTASQLQRAHADVALAQQDLTSLRQRVFVTPDPWIAAAGHFEQATSLLQSADALSSIALDGAQIVNNLLDGGTALVNALTASSLLGGPGAGSGMTPTQLQQLQQGYYQSLPILAHLLARLNATPTATLMAALNAKQRAELTPLLAFLPRIPPALTLTTQLMALAPQFLGVGQPANFLIMTMDTSEMRPTGGFQGNYGVFSMAGGTPSNVTLRDIYQVDDPTHHQCGDPGYEVPAAYASWWPFCPFGARDANLSPDFPTSAQMTMDRLTQLGGNNVYDDQGNVTATGTNVKLTGMVAIQPAVIGQLLTLTGGITVGSPYADVQVNATNFQSLIHYYQLTDAGRAVGGQAGQGDQISSANKRFTALLGRGLIAKLKTLPKEAWFTFAQQAVDDLHVKNIQMYFSDPTAEQFLRDEGISAELYRGDDDALTLNLTNASGNKASAYLSLDLYDTVTLNADGSADHALRVVHHFNAIIQNGYDQNEVYSVLYNGRHDYGNGLFLIQMERYYFSNRSQFSHAEGFVYDQEMLYHSDEPGRAMFGGFYLLTGDPASQPVQWNTPDTLVQWTTPQTYTPGQPYRLHIGSQSGTLEYLHVTVQQAGCATSPYAYDRPLTTDVVLTVPTATCSAQS